MYEIPLFPLNIVLFPQMPLHLHIFEDRYKQMINMCIAENRPFGMVLARSNTPYVSNPHPSPQSHLIGCTARVDQVKPLRDGRMDIVSAGQKRFFIHEFLNDKPYLVGKVETLEFDRSLERKDQIKGSYLRKLLKNYLNILTTMGNMEINLDELPSDPIEISYLAASLMQIPLNDKQTLLEIHDGKTLINSAHNRLRQEISILRNMLDPAISPNQDGPFSLN